jgi:hypothetical protein
MTVALRATETPRPGAIWGPLIEEHSMTVAFVHGKRPALSGDH